MRNYVIAVCAAMAGLLPLPATAFSLNFLMPATDAELGAVDWSGFVVNPDLGYEHFDLTGTGGALFGGAEGVRLGAEASYDWQSGVLVYGLASDLSWANIDGDEVDGAPVLRSARIDLTGSLRGRLGVARGRWLVYGLAGVGFANLEIGTPALGLSDQQVLTGWTAGGGIEYRWNSSTSVRAAYRRLDLGEETFSSLPAGSNEVGVEADLIDLGFVRRF